MSPILKILEDLAKKLGIAPAVLFIPFSIVAPFEVSAVQFFTKGALQDFLMFTPVMALTLYFSFYFFSVKIKALSKISLQDDNEKNIILRSTIYSVICFFISGISVAILINQKNVKADQALYHTNNNKAIAIASVNYVQLTDKTLNETTINNILNNGFVKPLNETFQENYNDGTSPTVKLLPAYLPTDLKTNFDIIFNEVKVDYSNWAKTRGYDIVIYGEAQQGESDKILLDLDFDIFDEPKTVQTDQKAFKLNYTVSNYDNDTLFATFDNMTKEISGITLYLDNKYDKAETIFTTVIGSLEREMQDFAETKATSESERKAFEQKRKRLQQNIGVVYFYLGNTLLLAEKSESAKTAYQKSQELLKINITSNRDIDSWLAFIKQMFNTYADNNSSLEMAIINNLSVSYAKNGDFKQAENVLLNSGTDPANNHLIAQNLGVVYLEKGIEEIKQQALLENKEISEADLSAQLAKIGGENQNIQKALQMLNQVGANLEKNQDFNKEQAQILKNNYHNQGVISLLQADFTKAEDFFSKELNMEQQKVIAEQNYLKELKDRKIHEEPIDKNMDKNNALPLENEGRDKDKAREEETIREMINKTRELKDMPQNPDKIWEEVIPEMKSRKLSEPEINPGIKLDNNQELLNETDSNRINPRKDLPLPENEKMNEKMNEPIIENKPKESLLPVEKNIINPEKTRENLDPVLPKDPINKEPIIDPRKVELMEKLQRERELQEMNEPVNTNPVEPVNKPIEPINREPINTVPAEPINREPINTVPAEPINREPINTAPVEPINREPINTAPVEPINTNPVEPVNREPVNTNPVEPVDPPLSEEGSALDRVREKFKQDQLDRMGQTTIE